MAINKLYNVVQTFYIDAAAVNSASEILLTSIHLFFKQKPNRTGNISGVTSPSVSISLCEVVNLLPNLSSEIPGSQVLAGFDNIHAVSDASIATIFKFNTPIPVKTGRFYGIMIKYDDPSYDVWSNKQGDKILGTNNTSSGSNNARDGRYFKNVTANGQLYPITDQDIKFKVNAAKFTANTANLQMVNDDYEFITLSVVDGTFTGGEMVAQINANVVQTVSVANNSRLVTTTNSAFSAVRAGDYLGIYNGSNLHVNQVSYVSNTTSVDLIIPLTFTNTAANFMIPVVGSVFNFNYIDKEIKLVDSNANSSVKFTANSSIKGLFSGANATILSIDDFSVDSFTPTFTANIPSGGTVDLNYSMSYSNGSSYILDSVNTDHLELNKSNEIVKYDAYIRSRSNEVDSPYIYGTERKSALSNITLSVNAANGSFTSPYIRESDLDFLVNQNQSIVSSTETVNGVEIDSEVYRNGLSPNKHISKRIVFANNSFAEDIRLFATAYRPLNTNIKVYAKIHNSTDPESFDDKLWTPLEIVENADAYSSSTNKDDLVEYTFGFPSYSETANAVPGTFKTVLSNNIITASGVTANTYIAANDVVKIFNPLFPTNYMVAGVTSSNSTAIVINTNVANNNVVGSGLYVDKLKYKNIGFSDVLNDGIVKYFNNDLAEFSSYDSMQIKIILTSNTTYVAPRVDVYQAIGVSA